ncbi:hypothetical protein TWF281_008507 [Arthrobotrys megalospora]
MCTIVETVSKVAAEDSKITFTCLVNYASCVMLGREQERMREREKDSKEKERQLEREVAKLNKFRTPPTKILASMG